ncbi:Vitelline membrane outer layer protein 1 [Folsomia candida]|uniref:Vitelline membrane outer layer protein 1 n=1 Tax=Folsomia candida TaxID=158441 RepID=A0A226DD00_FOLCA|nr:Vitelline membrane outer layer protein 1 [Folsomia candida]
MFSILRDILCNYYKSALTLRKMMSCILLLFVFTLHLQFSAGFHSHVGPPPVEPSSTSMGTNSAPDSGRQGGHKGEWIKSKRTTNWGDWGDAQFCPRGSFADGIFVKYEDLGTPDDTGINGIGLRCIFPDGRIVADNPTSSAGIWGDWIDCQCPKLKEFADGFKLCTLPPQGDGDDVSAYGFFMSCTTSGVHTCLYRSNWSQKFCSELIKCPKQYPRICGIQTQVEGTLFFGDDTSLNNVDFYCCEAK